MTAPTETWVDVLPDTEHVRFFRSCDWATTEVGCLGAWPIELRHWTLLAFMDTRPVCIYWGPCRISIYNQAYVLLAQGRHPGLMGNRFSAQFSEVNDTFEPVFEEVVGTRRTVDISEISLLLERNHFTEETFFSAAFIPLLMADGTVGGVYNSVLEVTRQKLTDRRTKMLNNISTSIDKRSSTNVYTHIARCLDTNRFDIPLAVLFEVRSESDDGNHHIMLLESLGLSKESSINVRYRRLFTDEPLMPLLRSAQTEIVTVPFEETWGDMEWGGHHKPSQYASAIPLADSGRLYGFLVVGNNPTRPVDDDYENFLSDLRRHLTSAVAADTSRQEALARQQRLQNELVESEGRIKYMAQHSDIGLMQLGLDGTLLWANEHYYRVVSHEDEGIPRKTFVAKSQLLEEDHDKAVDAWEKALKGQKTELTELRLRRKYTPPIGNGTPTTILLSAFAYLEEGAVKSIMACMTEVSRLKWAESWQAQMAHDAKEAKRQQSEFTDAISHEVRNPLSAILQLADGIAASFGELKKPTLQDCMQTLKENAEAAQTILSCAQHQKRIVDDVLTLSRMDFASISLSPVATHPHDLVNEALKILEVEASTNSIIVQIIKEPSLGRLGSDLVLCDQLRVTQILINLLSNAIKFTKREARRTITITYGAALSAPCDEFPPEIVWASPQRSDVDATGGPEWGDGDKVCITFSIADTGPGMTPEELKRVFQRFAQASPKTSVKYGGSGLGLFISHSLTETQGGRIGAMSTPGSGSTFAFYIEARRKKRSQEQTPTGHGNSNDNKQDANVEAGSESKPLQLLNSGPAKKTTSASADTMRLLLVEDNLINQRVLRKQLIKAGCVVHIANHGAEALDFLRTCAVWEENQGKGPEIDAILMDWEMPVMDGLTCTREIRALERSGQLIRRSEVIAITANVRSDQVRVAEEAGVDAVMPKPFVVEELLSMLRKRLER